MVKKPSLYLTRPTFKLRFQRMNIEEKLQNERRKLTEAREKLDAARNVPKPNQEQIEAHLSDAIAQAKNAAQAMIEKAGLKRSD
jgi:RNase H-fold protein (predicted Holliday junction resolvase)